MGGRAITLCTLGPPDEELHAIGAALASVP